MTAPTRRNQYFAGAILLVLGIALLPWWRNHGYLRDLYDYGLVLAANGHLDLGERPYVDFTTPIQAGFLSLNWLIERLGGGNYFALTLGGAGLIAVTGVSLTLMLARRWAWWAAAVIGGVVTISAASQHTILWHNSLGVFCLALVTWSAACAPVWRRSAWPWHALLLAGLFLGGINKLNFHLVAVAVALAWAVRAGLVRQAGWGRVGATATGILLAGLVLPVAAELAWTGVSLARWLANVVQLASGSRLGILQQILSPDFLLRPIHDYYGPVPLPQAGLAGVVLSLAVLIGCWPAATVATARWDRWLVPLAAGAAATAGAALLATNFEIASVGLGAWLVLVASLWLGFAPAGRRLVFLGRPDPARARARAGRVVVGVAGPAFAVRLFACRAGGVSPGGTGRSGLRPLEWLAAASGCRAESGRDGADAGRTLSGERWSGAAAGVFRAGAGVHGSLLPHPAGQAAAVVGALGHDLQPGRHGAARRGTRRAWALPVGLCHRRLR
jgi:hypothetical protein